MSLGCLNLNADGESAVPRAKSRRYYSNSGPIAVALKSRPVRAPVLGQKYGRGDEAARVDQWNQTTNQRACIARYTFITRGNSAGRRAVGLAAIDLTFGLLRNNTNQMTKKLVGFSWVYKVLKTWNNSKAVCRNFLPGGGGGGASLSKIFDGQSKRGCGRRCPPSHTRELLHFWDWNWTICCTLWVEFLGNFQ